MEEITEKCFICSKLGRNLSEISGSQDICKDTESNLAQFAGFYEARGE